MAGKNAINVLAEGEKRLDELNGKLKQTIENVLAINDAALKTGKNFFNVKTPKGLNESLNQNKTYVQQLNVELKERQRLEKALATQLERNRQAQSANAKALAQARFETQQLNRRAKEAAVLSSKLSTEYQKQAVRLTQLRRKYKDVALVQGESSKAARKLQIEIGKLDNRLKRVDANVGQFQRNVGNYGNAMRSAVSAARSLAGALGFTGGLYLAVQVFRDAANTVREFDKQVIAVQKTTNLTNPEIELFKDEVIELGLALKGVSIQGLLKSSEIAGQLGVKGRKNILKFSEVIEKLKLTSDIAGEESARSFAKFIEVSNDSVENADRLGSVITELGNNFATSESQILKNTTEIQKGIAIYDANAESVIGLGAATNALGAEAEQSRSALQKTFKVLNDGATTGKNLEKILALTGQTAEEFRKEFGENSVKTFQRFVEGLAKSDAAGQNLSNTLFDLGLNEKRTEAVIGVLAKNYDVLSDALSRANGEYKTNTALNKEAAKAAESLDSLLGDITDSWDGFILSLENGGGILGETTRTLLKFVDGLIKWNTIVLTSTPGQEKQNRIIKDQYTATKNLLEKQEASLPVLEGLLKINLRKLAQLETQKKFNNLTKEEIELNEKNQLKQQGVIKAIRELISTSKESVEQTEKDTKATDENTESKTKGIEALKGSIIYYTQLISKLEEQQGKLATNSKEWALYTEQIDEAKQKLADLKVEFEGLNFGSSAGLVEIEKIIDAINNPKEIKGLIVDEDEITKLADRLKEAQELELDIARETLELKRQLEQDFADSTLSIVNSVFDAKIMRYEEDIQRNNDYYANLLDNQALTEEQRDALEAERDRKNAEIEKKKRETERKAAIFNKAAALTEVAIDTVKQVAKIKAQAALLLANPFTAPLATQALAQIPFVIASGALAAGAIAARPIPKYEKGKFDDYEGAAIWGEKRQELKISKDGSMQLSPKKPGDYLTHVKKDDTIIPDAQKFLSNLSDKELYENIHKHTILSSMAHQSNTINSYLIAQSLDKGLKNQTKELVKALKGNRPKINLYNNNNISDDLKFLIKSNNTL